MTSKAEKTHHKEEHHEGEAPNAAETAEWAKDLVDHLVDIKLVGLLGILQPVSIQVIQVLIVCPPVHVDQHKSRAGNWVQRAPSLGYALHKGRFSTPQISLQPDHIPCLQQASQTHTKTAGLVGASAEELKRSRVENGH